MCYNYAGVTLIAEFCINIAFFGYRTYFGYITVLPYIYMYTKWLNTDLTSYGSLLLPCHLPLELLANLQTLSSKTVQLHTADDLQCHLSHGPALLSSMHYNYKSSQWNYWKAESGWWQNRHVCWCNFWTFSPHFFTCKSYPCMLYCYTIVSSTLPVSASVNEIHILFWRMIIDLKPDPNDTVSGRRIRLHIRLTRNYVSCQTDQWYFLVIQHRMRSQKQDWERASMPSHTVRVYQHLLKDWRL